MLPEILRDRHSHGQQQHSAHSHPVDVGFCYSLIASWLYDECQGPDISSRENILSRVEVKQRVFFLQELLLFLLKEYLSGSHPADFPFTSPWPETGHMSTSGPII